jgi:hypothetical protein
MHHLKSAGLPPAHAPFARGIRGATAVLITLVAPSYLCPAPSLPGLKGTSPAVGFPPGYGASLAATIAATTLAAVLAALIAGRDAMITSPVSLGLWAIPGASVVAEGLQLGHAGLTGWGWILVAASVIAAAAGMLLAAHRWPARRPPVSYRGPEPQDDERGALARSEGGDARHAIQQAHTRQAKEMMPIT